MKTMQLSEMKHILERLKDQEIAEYFFQPTIQDTRSDIEMKRNNDTPSTGSENELIYAISNLYKKN